MAVAPDKSQFDIIRFRKFVRLLDSDRDGERVAALNQALRLCGEHRPPLLFFEAAALAFGTRSAEQDELLTKTAKLQAEVTNLTRRLSEREAEAAQLADRYMDAQRLIEQLRQKAEREDRTGSHNFRALLGDLWSLPRMRLLLLTFVMICRIVIIWQFETGMNAWVWWITNIAFDVVELRIFAKWTGLQYAQDGLLQLLVKWSLLACGMLIAFHCLVERWPWEDWMSIAVMNGTDDANPEGAIAALGVFSVLAASKLSEWLIEGAGVKLWDSVPVQMLRRCF